VGLLSSFLDISCWDFLLVSFGFNPFIVSSLSSVFRGGSNIIMPPPAPAPVLSIEKGMTISNVSVEFDASIFKIWRDGAEYANADPEYPYWAMDIHVASWPCNKTTVLARYSGGKLQREALYQLRGRFFVDTSRHGGEPYLHIDEAIRYQGPGTIRSMKKPKFMMVGEVVEVDESHFMVLWVTRDPYRRNKVYEQSAVMHIEGPLPDMEEFVGQLCCLEGRMDSLDHRRDWACTGIKLC
jgi:hypothetical protein